MGNTGIKMITFYCDTETVQLNTDTINKVDLSGHKDFVEYRLKQSAEWVQKQYKKAEEEKQPQDLIVVNVLNTCSTPAREDPIIAYNPVAFFNKITTICKREFEKNALIYFHNMKFDLTNIIDYLTFAKAKFTVKNSLIVGTKWYSYTIIYKGVWLKFIDSYNLTMMALRDFGKAFGLPPELSKSSFEFDFNNLDIINRMLRGDKELTDYAVLDVLCLRAGMEKFYELTNSNKITIASISMEDWKKRDNISLSELDLKEQLDANLTYTGAICYPNPRYTGQTLEGDFVYIDNNGLYSASSYSEKAGFKHYFPVGKGTLYKNEVPDIWNIEKYYTIRARIKAKLKKNVTIPFFRLGKQYNLGEPMSRRYKQNDFITEFDETCYINSIDLRLLYKYYDIAFIKYDYFYEYKTAIGIFDNYIDHWSEMKVQSKINGNLPLRSLSKLMLNSLTGKFGQYIEPIDVNFELDDKTNIFYHNHVVNDTKECAFVYMPIVSAILAYSREIFLDMTNSYPEEDYFYSDTDSNILTRKAFEKYVDKSKIDSVELGKWDIEHEVKKLKIIRQKTYMLTDKNDELIIRCAGATPEIKQFLNYDNFEIGQRIEGATQLKPKIVAGGTALVKQPFILRSNFRM